MTSTTTSRARPVTDEAAATAIDAACRLLRLPTIRRQIDEHLAAAQREQHSYAGFLP